MKNILALSLAASFAALPASASVLAKDVCRGRTDLVLSTIKSVNAAEEGVALSAKGVKDPSALTVDQAVALVQDNAATNSGYCVAKTVIQALQAKGSIGSEIKVVDSGDDIALFVASVNDGSLVLYKNAGEVSDFVALSLRSYLYDVAREYEPTLKERCEELDRMPKPAGYPMPDYCVDLLKRK